MRAGDVAIHPVDRAAREDTLPARLIQQALTRGEEVACHVVAGDRVTSISWEQLLRQASAYADRYSAAGVVAGDPVLISVKHGTSQYPAYLGAMLLGAVPAFLPFPSQKQDPILYWETHLALFERIQARVMVTYTEHATDVLGALPPVTSLLPDESGPISDAPIADLAASFVVPHRECVALIQHSSGTTGQKKGVALTYQQIARQIESYSCALGFSEQSRIASWLPLYHDMGLVAAFLMPVYLGATVVSLDAFEWVFKPHMLLDLMDSYRCDYTWLPNFAFNHLVRTKEGHEAYSLDHVRAFISCSEPCKPQTFDMFAETFARHGVAMTQLQTSYAMAETVLAVSQSPLDQPVRRILLKQNALSAGRAVVAQAGPGLVDYLSNGPLIAGVEARVDPHVDTPGDGIAIGEIQLRGEFVFDGYDRNDKATAEAFVDGWYRTGDLGCVIDGELFVTGRLTDIIIHHGVNYYAHDLEAVASTVPGIKPGRCAAVAAFDDASGSEHIELIAERQAAGLTDADEQLGAEVKRAIADRFEVMVARVHLVEPGWLVKTTSGKVSRRENAMKLQRQPPTVVRRAGPSQDVEQAVIDTIASTFAVDPATIGPETVAADVEGWDSLGHTVLMIRLGTAVGVPVPEDVASGAASIAELIDLLVEHLAQRKG